MITLFYLMGLPSRGWLFSRRGVLGFVSAGVRMVFFAAIAIVLTPAVLQFAGTSEVVAQPTSFDDATLVMVLVFMGAAIDLLVASGAALLVETAGVIISVLRILSPRIDAAFSAKSGGESTGLAPVKVAVAPASGRALLLTKPTD